MKKLFTILLFLAMPEFALAQSNFDGLYIGLTAGRARGVDKGTEYKNNGATFQGVTQQTTPKGNFYGAFLGANMTAQPLDTMDILLARA